MILNMVELYLILDITFFSEVFMMNSEFNPEYASGGMIY